MVAACRTASLQLFQEEEEKGLRNAWDGFGPCMLMFNCGGDPCVHGTLLGSTGMDLSSSVRSKEAEQPWCGSCLAKDRAGFSLISLEFFLLRGGKDWWGMGGCFSIAHPAAYALGHCIHEIIDGKHHRADHEQSQYEGQLYINGHVRDSICQILGIV